MELGFIQSLQRHFNPSGGVGGIGDDGAFVPPYVYVSDTVVEGVHFFPSTPWHHVLGYLFASNISDMAAMGGRAEYGILNISASPAFLSDEVAGIIKSLCSKNRIQLIGGDTCGGSKVVLSLTLFGRVGAEGGGGGNILVRSGACVGDIVFVSRPVGLTNITLANEAKFHHNHCHHATDATDATLQGLLGLHPYHHYNRPPEVDLGETLGGIAGVTSCMDVSDGIGVDLSRLGRSSGVRCVVHEEAVPLSHIQELMPHVQGLMGVDGVDVGTIAPLEHFMGAGQEFALLFTVSKGRATEVQGVVEAALGRKIIPIGWCEELESPEDAGAVVLRRDGTAMDISAMGWVHGT